MQGTRGFWGNKNKRATLKDVATHAGLSVSTISKYVNGGNVRPENRPLVERAIRELGFRPNEIARGLKGKRSSVIGVLIPSLSSNFSNSVATYVDRALAAEGFTTIICDYVGDRNQAEKKIDFLLGHMVDGIITMPLGVNMNYLNAVIEQQIPTVLFDSYVKDVPVDTVLINNCQASCDAVEHLIKNGHRRIGVICGPQETYTGSERLKGYMLAHEKHGLPVEQELVKIGTYANMSGRIHCLELLDEKSSPTAIFATSYGLGIGAISALQQRRIVSPDQMSLISFDHAMGADEKDPWLSTVVSPIAEIAETAVSLVLERILENPDREPETKLLKAKFIEGRSVISLAT